MESRDLDAWIARPTLRVAHRLQSHVAPEQLWSAAQEIRLRDTRLLGRVVRWRIPGLEPGVTFQGLFSCPPFLVLAEEELSLVSGIVGRIWTLRRDYPQLQGAEEFRSWRRPGTVRVAFANWVESASPGSALCSETRLQAFGVQGRLGLASVRPLIRTFQQQIRTDALAAAVRSAEA